MKKIILAGMVALAASSAIAEEQSSFDEWKQYMGTTIFPEITKWFKELGKSF